MLFIILFSDISLRETCPTNTSLEFVSKFYQRSILSPNYPHRYILTDNCSWLIQSNLSNGAGYIIEVVINAFLLEGSENSLSFYDGVSPTTSRLLGTYRRSYSPDHGVFYTTGPFLYVELKVQKTRWRTDGYWLWKEYRRGRFNVSLLAVKKGVVDVSVLRSVLEANFVYLFLCFLIKYILKVNVLLAFE